MASQVLPLQLSDAMQKASILVLGAAGHMGLALKQLLSERSAEFVGVDLLPPGASEAPAAALDEPFAAFHICDASAPTPAVADAVATSDIVVLALPLAQAQAALAAIRSALRDGALVVETSSVKAPASELTEIVPDGVEFLGINPLFAPALDWSGRPVLVTPYRSGPMAAKFISWLRAAEADVAEVSPGDHDALLAKRQGAIHAAILAFGAVLAAEHSHGSQDELPLHFGPPPYQLGLMLLARMLEASPHVYAEIQAMNSEAADVRAVLASALAGMDGSTADVTHFIEALSALKQPLEPAAKACDDLFRAGPLLPKK